MDYRIYETGCDSIIVVDDNRIEDQFLCRTCRHWRGGYNCEVGYYLPYEGFIVLDCQSYEIERRKRKD